MRYVTDEFRAKIQGSGSRSEELLANKKLSCRKEAARCTALLKILLSSVDHWIVTFRIYTDEYRACVSSY